MEVSSASAGNGAGARLRLRLPAEPDAALTSRRAVTEFARANGAMGHVLGDIALAVSEAVSNVIIHAYRERPGPGVVDVEGERDGDALRVVVRDDGSGIAPRPDSPGIGYGLTLIAGVARALEIRARPEGGAELRMTFDLA